jgi:lipoprotein-anchoring transpeptidase ErfK/SrfK
MNRVPFAAALAGFTFLVVGPAGAGPITTQPLIVSSDLTSPWVIQLKRGNHAGLAFATLRRSAPLPTAPAPTRYGRAIDPAFLPRTVDYVTSEAKGTIIIDTGARYLYLILGDGKAERYGVGVGRPGFEWAGVHRITRKAEWPDWVPPEQMRERQPGLPAQMAGGIDNPLGARALYLGSTLYRIHGSNQPWTIGQAVSSGCIRMRNQDVIDLYDRVGIGTKVIVI